MRLGGDYWGLEKHLLRNFRKYAHNIEEQTGESIWNWLTIAQHHGLPTRLLDWTYSPLVALHFATTDYFEEDSVVWKVDYHQSLRHLPKRLLGILEDAGGNVFTAEVLANAVNSLDEFELLSRDDFFIFLEPQSMDARIVNQFAVFSVASNPRRRLDELLSQRDVATHKIIVPADIKWEVRDHLDQANVTERVLFPGLDGLSRWLKRHYSPAIDGRITPRALSDEAMG